MQQRVSSLHAEKACVTVDLQSATKAVTVRGLTNATKVFSTVDIHTATEALVLHKTCIIERETASP